ADGCEVVVEGETVIDVVHDEVEAFLFAELHHLLDEFLGIHDAGGVVGTIEDDGFRVGTDSVGNLLYGGKEGTVFGFDNDGDAARELDHFRIADPVWRGENPLFLGIENRMQENHQCLFGAAGGDDVSGMNDFFVV